MDITVSQILPEKPKRKSVAKSDFGLNLQQTEFCKLYIQGDKETFGNGTACYLEIYGAEYLLKNKRPMKYQTAMVNASNLLRNPKIITFVNSLLETGGFTNQNVDKQHLFLINQHADFKSKLGAIREYNALKKRIERKEGDTYNQFNFFWKGKSDRDSLRTP